MSIPQQATCQASKQASKCESLCMHKPIYPSFLAAVCGGNKGTSAEKEEAATMRHRVVGAKFAFVSRLVASRNLSSIARNSKKI